MRRQWRENGYGRKPVRARRQETMGSMGTTGLVSTDTGGETRRGDVELGPRRF